MMEDSINSKKVGTSIERIEKQINFESTNLAKNRIGIPLIREAYHRA
jgi:hypothetical protein